jgi:hypothetical protein
MMNVKKYIKTSIRYPSLALKMWSIGWGPLARSGVCFGVVYVVEVK